MKHAIRDEARTEPVDGRTEPMDDLMVGLARARRGPLLTRGTGALLGLVLMCGGFLAGVQVQQHFGTSAGSAASAGGAGANRAGARGGFTGQGLPGGFPGAGQNGGQTGTGNGQAAGSSVTGKIKLIDGSTVYVETADGQIVTIKTSGTTTVQNATKVDLTKLKAGTQVTIQGTTQNDTLTATSITATK
ncbi:hypothetical protein QEZ54_12470 [Catellatospora sp. KI3]|uniref:hypothetical protein n=1 Tax=Catellatospora sp. KI3 TaxID=3041620 RepID=UPI00248252FE|nr:hypothetical protein [Catellatospora sp. KI3]MDI1461790.1 hypothetical protein [Catellatospora sp. KI3]